MKKNIEPEEIVLARKANLEVIKRIEDLIGKFRLANREKQTGDKVSGSFIYCVLALKHIAEFMYGEQLTNLINEDMKKSGLEKFEEFK